MGETNLSSDSLTRQLSDPTNVARSLLDGDRDHLLAAERSEFMKQEYKVESLNTCIDELQQQTYLWRKPFSDMKNLEESKFDNRKELVVRERKHTIQRLISQIQGVAREGELHE